MDFSKAGESGNIAFASLFLNNEWGLTIISYWLIWETSFYLDNKIALSEDFALIFCF